MNRGFYFQSRILTGVIDNEGNPFGSGPSRSRIGIQGEVVLRCKRVQSRSVLSPVLADEQIFECGNYHRDGRGVHGLGAAEGSHVVRLQVSLLLHLEQRTHVEERNLLGTLRFLSEQRSNYLTNWRG